MGWRWWRGRRSSDGGERGAARRDVRGDGEREGVASCADSSVKRDIARRRTLLGLSALFLGAAQARGQAPAVSHTIDLATPDRATDYDYLRTAVGARSIVQLGESIHLTDEFPRARLRLVQHLHESIGFDVLALEGSVVNAWLAMERLYGAPTTPPRSPPRRRSRGSHCGTPRRCAR